MAPFEQAPDNQTKVSEKPLLQIATTPTTPVKSPDPRFDWSHWDGPGWHNQSWPRSDIKICRGRLFRRHPPLALSPHSSIRSASSGLWLRYPMPYADIKPDSPQSLPSLDHPSPTSEELSRLPKCSKCGLTTKQHEMVKAYICGHLCPDFLHDKICPDIDAAHLSRKDCPIHNPKGRTLNRRRSSLSKSPMLALDESTYEDVDEGKNTKGIVQSPGQDGPDQGNETMVQNAQSKISEKLADRICDDGNGNTDWQKHCRVEKAMRQILFGDARVAEHVALEHTHRLSINERNPLRETRDIGIATADDHDDIRSAMAAGTTEAERHIDKLRYHITAAESKKNQKPHFKATKADSAGHLDDCAICSDEGSEDEFHEAMYAAKPGTRARGCASDEECGSCAGDPDSHVSSRDLAQEEPPRHFAGRNIAC